MHIESLSPSQFDAAIELWHDAGLTRPWNDPVEAALRGPAWRDLHTARGVETLWKRFANGPVTAFWCVANRGVADHEQPAEAPQGSAVFRPTPFDRFMTKAITEERSRVAYCECGAQLAGATRGQFFDAAQAHLAHHHPELLGALGPGLVQQMAEEHPGAVNV